MGGKNSGRKRDMSEEAFVKHFERCKFVEGENAELIRKVALCVWRNLITFDSVDKECGVYEFTTHDNLKCSAMKVGCHAIISIHENGQVNNATKTWAKYIFRLLEEAIAIRHLDTLCEDRRI